MTSAWKHMKRESCPHLAAFQKGAASSLGKCAERGHGDDLRICLTCGYVACCESHAAHNTAHYRSSGHPLIMPHKCDYQWLWCYECSAFLE